VAARIVTRSASVQSRAQLVGRILEHLNARFRG